MSAASRSFDVLLVSVLLVAVTRCQSIGCFNAGECAGGNINGFNEGIALARDCLEVCKDNTNCKAFTHYALDGQCVTYDSCPSLNPATCTDCVSGDSDCTDEDGCFFSGMCRGTILTAFASDDFDGCRNNCEATNNCRFFTFKSTDNICLQYITCPSTTTCPSCVSAPKTCEIDVPTKFMMVTGYDKSYLNSTEFIDLNSASTSCRDSADFPYAVTDTVAANIEGDIWACGGVTEDTFVTDCYNYNILDNNWTNAPNNLLIPREYSADVMTDVSSWWVTGGSGFAGALDTTEILRFGEFIRGPDLPFPMSQHCVAKVDATRYFFAGGTGGDASTALMYDIVSDMWTSLPNMPRGRYGHVCQAISTISGGIEIIVAGGFLDSSSDIYRVDASEWTTGPDLPKTLFAPSAVLMGRNMVVTGGFSQSGRSTDVYTLDRANGLWDKMSQSLKVARNHAAMVPVSDAAAHCV